MNKRVAIPVITVLASAVIATGYFVVQQSNKLGEAGSEIVALEENVSALEENVSALEENVSTLEESGSVLEVKLTDLEAKVSTLEADLDKANDDVELEQKLVGQGAYVDVLMPNGTIYDMGTNFAFTNPDCVSEITIDRISIFTLDGTAIYEGPLLRSGDGVIVETPWMEPMRPHETRIIRLDEMVPYAFPDWMEVLESENEMIYTVEIFWSGAKEGLPLTGWASTSIVKRESPSREVIDIISGWASQMVNMEQALDSED